MDLRVRGSTEPAEYAYNSTFFLSLSHLSRRSNPSSTKKGEQREIHAEPLKDYLGECYFYGLGDQCNFFIAITFGLYLK